MKDLIKMNLQLFADGDESDESNEQEKTYTAAELQAESDRKVSLALETQRKKLEIEINAKIEAERKEAAELAKMSEKEQTIKAMEKKESEIAKRESDLQRQLLAMQTKEDLIAKNLPVEFATFCISETPEQTLENINSFEKLFKAAVEKELNERIKANSGTPQGSGNSGATVNPWSAATFNLTEQGKLLQTNPELARQLMATAVQK